MKISTAQIKEYLKKKGGTAKRIQNLWIEVGTGNPKEIHFRFYWKQSGRRYYRHVASLGADTKPKQVKMADEKYQTMYANLRMGITPLDTEKSEAKAIKWKELEHGYRLTVEQLFEEYFEVKKANREPAGWIADQQRYRNHIHPIIGKVFAEDVRRSDLNKIIQRLVKAEKNTQAHYIARFLRAVWLWAFRYDPDKYPLNPELAASLDAPQISRGERVATKAELTRILQVGSPLSKALLYMGNRRMDTRQMGWDDFDEDDKNWLEIPKEKYKRKEKSHRIYITDTVLGLIAKAQEIAPSNTWCFVGARGNCISQGTQWKQWQEIELEELRPKNEEHSLRMQDVRRTFFSWIEEHYSYEIAGVVSGHVKPGIGRTYGKYEYKKQKVEIMKRWEQRLNALSKN